MRQMCQVKLSPDSMRQFNPAHLSLRQFNLARLSHVGGDAAVDGNAQAARSNERGDARKRDGHRGHAANAVHNNEPLGVPRGMFDARVGRFFATLRVDTLREPAKAGRVEPEARSARPIGKNLPSRGSSFFYRGESGAQRSVAALLCARCMPTCPECGVRHHFSAGQ